MAYPRTGRALIAVLAASMLVATACAGSTPSASNEPSGSAAASAGGTEKPQDGGRIISGSISDIATMQPVLVNDTASGEVVGLIYANLIDVDPKTGEPKPGLATFSASSDGLTYTFTIDDKANWSDGKPIIAQDYATGIQAVAKSAKTVRKSSFTTIVGFQDFVDGKTASIAGIKIDASNKKKFTVT